MKLSENKQVFISAAAAAAVLYFLYSTIFMPSYDAYKKLYEKERTFRSRIDKNVDIIRNSDLIHQSYALLAESYALTGEDEEELLKTEQEIDRLSRESEVKISKIQRTSSQDIPDYKHYSLQLECTGSLDRIMKLLFSFSRSEMLFEVLKVRLQPAGAQTDDLSANVLISRIAFPQIKKKEEASPKENAGLKES